MKKIILVSCLVPLVSLSARAVCPPGWTEIDAGAIHAFHASACPAGYSEISSPIILPSPVGGSDSKGTFTYGACNYQ